MSAHAVTRVSIQSEGDDPLESVRRSLAFADAMVAEGATVTVTGDLSFTVRFEVEKPKPDEEAQP